MTESRAQRLATHLAGRLSAYLEDLRLLSGMDCGSANQAGVNRVGQWVLARCAANGWRTQVHPCRRHGDLVEARLEGHGGPKLLLLAHMDTVYPEGVAAQRPMRLEGGTIFGPGTADMKAGLLAGIYAVEALQALAFTAFGRITLLFTGDEEVGSPESSPITERLARDSDAALVLEAARASGALVAARKGIIDYTLEVRGRAAHAGVEPEKGRNALLELAHQIVALQDLNGTIAGATVNVGLAQAGSALNVVPELATARLEARALDAQSLEAIDCRIRAVTATTTVPETSVALTAHRGYPPMPRTAATEHLVALAQASARDLGFSLQAVGTGGASDACLVASAGIPVLDGLGPIGGDDHSPREWVALDSIVPRVAMLADLIARISEGGAAPAAAL